MFRHLNLLVLCFGLCVSCAPEKDQSTKLMAILHTNGVVVSTNNPPSLFCEMISTDQKTDGAIIHIKGGRIEDVDKFIQEAVNDHEVDLGNDSDGFRTIVFHKTQDCPGLMLHQTKSAVDLVIIK
jgi:hypothetical protein